MNLNEEFEFFKKQERTYLENHYYKKESLLTELLEKKIPEKLQETLDKVFLKSFEIIFEKGTTIIEKTYNKEEMGKETNQDSFMEFKKKASNSSAFNVIVSSLAGIGMGVLGVGLPDIILFTCFILRSVYEIASHYGFEYESEEEKIFLLLLIQGALSYEKELGQINRDINTFIQYGRYKEKKTLDEQMKKTAACLSGELLYSKFLQGFMIVGAIGGAYDYVFLKRITDFSKLKYQRRYLVNKQKNNI